jgi:hypothetical protein
MGVRPIHVLLRAVPSAQGTKRLSYTEARAHFDAWCVLSSPLILGFDVTNRLVAGWVELSGGVGRGGPTACPLRCMVATVCVSVSPRRPLLPVSPLHLAGLERACGLPLQPPPSPASALARLATLPSLAAHHRVCRLSHLCAFVCLCVRVCPSTEYDLWWPIVSNTEAIAGSWPRGALLHRARFPAAPPTAPPRPSPRQVAAFAIGGRRTRACCPRAPEVRSVSPTASPPPPPAHNPLSTPKPPPVNQQWAGEAGHLVAASTDTYVGPVSAGYRCGLAGAAAVPRLNTHRHTRTLARTLELRPPPHPTPDPVCRTTRES